MGLTQPTDIFHHSTESWKQGEEDRTWTGDSEDSRGPKNDKFSHLFSHGNWKQGHKPQDATATVMNKNCQALVQN